MTTLEALKTRDGSIYLGGAAVTMLIALLTGVSTLRAYVHQWEMREAVQAFAQGSKDARKLLGDLRQSDSGNQHDRATVRVMLGSYNYDRSHSNAQLLETAERLFSEALEIDSGRASAAIGLACVRLRQAEVKDRDARGRDADSAIAELRGNVEDFSLPDVQYIEGAALILQGKSQEALEKLDDPNPSEAPSLQGNGARYWNHGVAELLAGGATAFESFALGYQMRPLAIPRELDNEPLAKDAPPPGRAADAPRILEQAYRVCLSRPGEKESLLDRCERARRLMVFYSKGGPNRGQLGRFLPHRDDMAKLHNALGLAYFQAEDHAQAAEQFEQAVTRTGGKEPLYQLNHAWSLYKLAESHTASEKSEDKRARLKSLQVAADLFGKVCAKLATQKGRMATVRLARTNAAAIKLMSGNHKAAVDIYQRHTKDDPNIVDWKRDLGALYDHAGRKREAISNYREAIDLQHPEGGELEERIAVLRSR